MTSTSKDDGVMSVAKRLYATDETFQEVADLLFGGGADELVSKLAPVSKRRRSIEVIDAADAATKESESHSKNEKRLARVGQVTNGVAIAGGVHALGAAMANPKLKDGGRASRASYKTGKAFEHGVNSIPGMKRASSWAAKPKNAGKLAGAAVGLHVAELVGDGISHKFLHDAAKKDKVHKSEPGSSDVHSMSAGKLKLVAAQKGVSAAKKGYDVSKEPVKRVGKGGLKLLNDTPHLAGEAGTKIYNRVKKNDGFTFEGEFSKVDSDKRQVFGWASIVELNGEPVVDLQGDYIDINEIEKSAYDYVIKSRKGGEMHRRSDDGQPVHASDMIESFIVTPEKIEKMGLPKSTPIGWWVGYQVNDDDAWNLVKSGKRTGFSIHGRGMRTPTEM